MARSRFLPDTGLTVRMTTVLFLLGALFVGIVVSLMFLFDPAYAPFIGIAGIGVAFYQWWSSDKVAMRAMRAREVSAQEAPELHEMVGRLCALADMPKPRVGIADTPMPNAFATGRSPDRAVVCVTTGILQTLTAEELEAVLAHELAHVAHRDVLVMTLASSAGIVAGMLTRSAQFGGFGAIRRGSNNGGAPAYLVALVLSLVVYAISFFLTRLLSRYRELSADRSGAYLTMKPAALASALQKIAGGINQIPQRDLRATSPLNAFFIAPAVSGLTLRTLTSTHPSLEQRLDQLARIQAELSRPEVEPVGLWDALTGRSRAPQPDLDALFAVPSAAIALETELGFRPTGTGSVCFRAPEGAAYDETQADVLALLREPDGESGLAPDVSVTRDSYGYTWLVVAGDPADVGGLCTDLHAVNTTLGDQGFAHGLLCTVVPFADSSGRRVGLVYLYKQGSFYPFAPARAAADGTPPGPLARDNLLELSVRDVLSGELPLEQDLSRWLAVYGAPGL